MKKFIVLLLLIPALIFIAQSDEGISGSNAVININVTLNDSVHATIITADTVRTDTLISGGASFTDDVTIDSSLTLQKVIADTVRTDTLISGGASFTDDVKLDSGIVASAVLSDSAAFVTTSTRLAKYIPGASRSDIYIATPRGLDAGDGSEALPVSDDLIKCVSKQDSVIFLRPAGTTSGLKFNWSRFIKK